MQKTFSIPHNFFQYFPRNFYFSVFFFRFSFCVITFETTQKHKANRAKKKKSLLLNQKKIFPFMCFYFTLNFLQMISFDLYFFFILLLLVPSSSRSRQPEKRKIEICYKLFFIFSSHATFNNVCFLLCATFNYTFVFMMML